MKANLLIVLILFLVFTSCKSQSKKDEYTDAKSRTIIVYPTFENRIEGDSMEYVSSRIAKYLSNFTEITSKPIIQGDSILIKLPANFSEEELSYVKRFLLNQQNLRFC